MVEITPDAVIRTADVAAKQAMTRLHADADLAHKRGYHAYSAALTNLATKIEKSLHELIDEMEAL